jgi:hypothetical protein
MKKKTFLTNLPLRKLKIQARVMGTDKIQIKA